MRGQQLPARAVTSLHPRCWNWLIKLFSMQNSCDFGSNTIICRIFNHLQLTFTVPEWPCVVSLVFFYTKISAKWCSTTATSCDNAVDWLTIMQLKNPVQPFQHFTKWLGDSRVDRIELDLFKLEVNLFLKSSTGMMHTSMFFSKSLQGGTGDKKA